MKRFLISTIDPDAARVAKKYGLGLEIAQFCTARNIDERFDEIDAIIRRDIEKKSRVVLHAPFNELFPCAIDPKARLLAAERYRQALALAQRYGAEKLVIHAGFQPYMYYSSWFIEQSVAFWREFLHEGTAVPIVLENVLETEPQWLADIVHAVDSPDLRLCLDIGHAHVYSKVPLSAWLDSLAPDIDHFHIHNNHGQWDEHAALFDGDIPMRDFLERALSRCPQASFTLELPESEASVSWLSEVIS